MKLFRIVLYLVCVVLIALIIYANYNLYYTPEFSSDGKAKVDEDLLMQLNYLEKSLDDSIAFKMQEDFPEGFFFSNLMYGLSWCELGRDLPDDSPIKKKAITESLQSLNSLGSDFCKENFDRDLSLAYGAFYSGWTNYLRGKILNLSNSFTEQESVITDFNENCNRIASAINKSNTPFLESYLNAYWPADIVPGIASLAIHDNLFGANYGKTIEAWYSKVESRREFNKCLFPHSVDSTGISLQNERGSSLGLILILLTEVSGSMAHNQFPSYTHKYYTDFLSLPMVREFEENSFDDEDVDSGPVIFGKGSVATIIGAGVFKKFGMINVSDKMFQTIECLGFPYTNDKNKKYLAGLFPMADFFIAWTKSLNPPGNFTISGEKNSNWRLTFHFVCLIPVIVLLLPFLRGFKSDNK